MVNGAEQTAQPVWKRLVKTPSVCWLENLHLQHNQLEQQLLHQHPRTTASTQQVVMQQPTQDPALQIGSRGSYIPSTGFTTP